ncbi:MAG: N-acetylglucosamine-6-phosphate deacetylase [Terriglobia bacterium]|nr:N-acetylglucosamine-6-phosphate deacetylase [Terriglobia bacterium]
MITAITAAELLSSTGQISSPVILVEDGVITKLGPASAVEIPGNAALREFSGAVLAPGFIDIHIHGSAGYDVMQGDQKGLEKMASFLAQRGVTSFLATTVTAETPVLLASIERLAEQIHNWHSETAAAVPFGIHMEGPWISKARCGVHPTSAIENPTLEMFDRYYRAANGHLRLITIAPELPGATELIREAVKRGVRISLGHTDGLQKDADAAIEAGATHATHTFNAMRPLNHREPGVVGRVLASEAMSAEIIADGIHVDQTVVELFLRCKGVERSVLVTDAISASGMPDGKYKLGTFEVTVQGSRCEFGGKLAGSVLTLEGAVQNVMRFSGWGIEDAVRLVTANPARVIGESGRGALTAGNRADITVLSRKGEVIECFAAGIPAIGKSGTHAAS